MHQKQSVRVEQHRLFNVHEMRQTNPIILGPKVYKCVNLVLDTFEQGCESRGLTDLQHRNTCQHAAQEKNIDLLKERKKRRRRRTLEEENSA